jgi:hypothetical protein
MNRTSWRKMFLLAAAIGLTALPTAWAQQSSSNSNDNRTRAGTSTSSAASRNDRDSDDRDDDRSDNDKDTQNKNDRNRQSGSSSANRNQSSTANRNNPDDDDNARDDDRNQSQAQNRNQGQNLSQNRDQNRDDQNRQGQNAQGQDRNQGQFRNQQGQGGQYGQNQYGNQPGQYGQNQYGQAQYGDQGRFQNQQGFQGQGQGYGQNRGYDDRQQQSFSHQPGMPQNYGNQGYGNQGWNNQQGSPGWNNQAQANQGWQNQQGSQNQPGQRQGQWQNGQNQQQDGYSQQDRPRLGIMLASHPTHGVVVQGVSPETPAQHGGVYPGDQIVTVNGQHVFSNRQLVQLIQQAPQGPLNLGVIRNGQMMNLPVTLSPNMGPNFHPGMFHERPALGVLLDQNGQNDVRIQDVIPGGPAAEVGLQRGDRIVAIGNRGVSQVDDVVNTLSNTQPHEHLPIRFDRNGRLDTVWIEPHGQSEVFQAQQNQGGQQQDFNR